ncbi:MAG: DoxX family protein [Gemmatimonadota bacterium]
MPSFSATHILRALRIVACGLIFIHGFTRIVDGGVVPFGAFLNDSHLPFGLAIAWGITLLELVGTAVLASGHLVRPLALYFATELCVGIELVHVHAGWFVVGGGSNGMEYSVLLIAVFAAVALGSEGSREPGAGSGN